MKSFSERSPVVIGLTGITVVVAIVLAALNYQKLPFFSQGKEYSAYFVDAGGLFTGATVEVSGYPIGEGVRHRTRRVSCSRYVQD